MKVSAARRERWTAAGLIALGAVPVFAGVFRVGELAVGAEVTPANARFFATPLPVVLHVVTAVPYLVLGAFQFLPRFRRRRPGWHRAAGRLLVPCGLGVALTGLWMGLFHELHPADGEILLVLRVVFGSAMAGSIVLGLAAARRGRIGRHRAWMIRGYAIGQGAGTQFLVHLPWIAAFGQPGELPKAVLMGAAWTINVAVAEWIIRRRPAGRARAAARPAADLAAR